MTADELIAQASEQVLGPTTPDMLTLDATAAGLREVLEMILETIHYEQYPESAPAIIARMLAAVCWRIEDGVAHRPTDPEGRIVPFPRKPAA